jgi:hypothetical protein
MRSSVCSSEGSIETSNGLDVRSSSQMSVQFREAQATTRSGASVLLGRNGSQR